MAYEGGHAPLMHAYAKLSYSGSRPSSIPALLLLFYDSGTLLNCFHIFRPGKHRKA